MESEETAVLPAETPPAANSVEAASESPITPVSGDAPVASDPATALDEAVIRLESADRIRAESRLPGGLRERLANVVAESAQPLSVGQEPSLTLSQVANLFAETLPSFLTSPPRLVEHPQGERFFHGEAVSSEEAEKIARQQLERTGFQRVS